LTLVPEANEKNVASTAGVQEAQQVDPFVISTLVSLTETVVSSSEIQPGDALTITASENIRTQKEFTAKEIQIQARTQ
jgi:hypothetical protein